MIHISERFLKMSTDFVLVRFDYEQEQLELLKVLTLFHTSFFFEVSETIER